MKLTLKTKTLAEAAQFVDAVGDAGNGEQYKDAVLVEVREDRLRLTAHNPVLSASAVVRGEGSVPPAQAVVSRQALAKLAATERGETVRLSVDEAGLRCGRFSLTARVGGFPRAESRSVASDKTLLPLDAAALQAALDATKHCRSDEPHRPHMSGVLWSGTDVATLGEGASTLACWAAGVGAPGGQLLLQNAAADALERMLDPEHAAEAGQVGGWLRLRQGDRTIATRLGDAGAYPGTWRTIWRELAGLLRVNRKDLLRALQRTRILREYDCVNLSVAGDQLVVEAVSPTGQLREEVALASAESPGEGRHYVNTTLLAAAVSTCDGEDCRIRWERELDPIYIVGDKFRQVILPMR